HPVMPFATEEIWQTLRRRLTGKAPGDSATDWPSDAPFAASFGVGSIVVAQWPKRQPSFIDSAADAAISQFQEVIGAIRNIRGEMKVPVEMKVDVLIEHADASARAAIEAQRPAIQALAQVDNVVVGDKVEHPQFASTYVSGAMTILVPLPGQLRDQEKSRL